jgi:integrase
VSALQMHNGRGARSATTWCSPGRDGGPLKPGWIYRRFKQLARQAGLPDDVRVYDLRHGWATAARKAGVHPKPVQEVMRHSSYTTTADTYTHVTPTHSAEAVQSD